MDQINGMLFPGGGIDLMPDGKFDPFTESAQVVWDYAKELNDKGDFFPLWGTCQGHELFATLVAGTDKILGDSDQWHDVATLQF